MHRHEFLHQNARHLPRRGGRFVDAVRYADGVCLPDEVHALYERALRGEFRKTSVPQHASAPSAASALSPAPAPKAPPVSAQSKERSTESSKRPVHATAESAASDAATFSVFDEAARRVRARDEAAAVPSSAQVHQIAAVAAAPVRNVRSTRRIPWKLLGGKKTVISLAIAAPIIDVMLLVLTDLPLPGVVLVTLASVTLILAGRVLDTTYRLRLGPRLRITGRFLFTTASIFGLLFVSLNAASYWDRMQYFLRGGSLNAETQQEQILEGLLPDQRRPQEPTVGATPLVAPEQEASSGEADVSLQSGLVKRQEQLSFSGFAVAPPDDRLIIPKLGKNVPIVQTPDTSLLTQDWGDLERQIQSDLERGVVHYPGTAQPGEKGNVFLTGHSSYYPWAAGRYKSVFALLDQLVVGDQVIVYNRGEKFVYTASRVMVVTPDRTDVLSQPNDDSILTLMTCTPVGTAKNRLIIQFRQVSPDPSLNRTPTVNDGSRIVNLQA